MKVETKRFHSDAVLPKFALRTDTAMDVFALEHTLLIPGKVTKVRTGVGIDVPVGYAYFIKDKSSVGSMGVTTLGGVFDAGYQGEIIAIMFNLTDHEIIFEKAQKLCQIVFIKIEQPELIEVEEYSKASERGMGGFGSTGHK